MRAQGSWWQVAPVVIEDVSALHSSFVASVEAGPVNSVGGEEEVLSGE